MPGVPATTDMHFRNGAVAISYVSIALLPLVDEGVVNLDDKVSRWLPDLLYGDQVTLGQLAQMTSGYVDYVTAPELTKLLYADPFRTFTPEDLIAISTKRPLLYRPGTNWNYAHTNYVILGLAMEKITGKPMTQIMQERVLGPLGLDNTTDPDTPAITEPALHAYSSERRYALKIPASITFTEDATYWNPSWTITHGAIQTTNIDDMHTSAVAIGTGQLLKPATFQQMITKDLIAKTTTVKGCLTCFPQQPGVHLRTGHRLLRRLAGAGPAVLRRVRRDRLSPVAAGGDRRSGDLRAGGLHQPGLAEKFSRLPVAQDRGDARTSRRPDDPPND